MPTSVADVFAAAGLRPKGVVPWGTPIPEGGSGVYVVALTDDVADLSRALAECPLAAAALQRLLDVRPELRLDGRRPDADELGARLASCWLPDEVILYIGLAGTSLRRRVGD